ncbi:hypothetical protein AYI69_g3851 [Smittium culicis]|uniref:Uncharacterized protein n=1 Tax=Smittium culicis TaxID=133412 RepID=A0A1R1YIH9_9FUNG|nr:hypothetical protein AYI69_g3851 [Smittium culicis]
MADKNNSKKSHGFKNIEPARNSSVFLPHVPGKNYENPRSFDDVTIYETILFDDMAPSDGDDFCYNVADYDAEYVSFETVAAENAATDTAAENAALTASDTVTDTATEIDALTISDTATDTSADTDTAAETAASQNSALPASAVSVCVSSDSASSDFAITTAAAKTASADIAASSSFAPSDSASSVSKKLKRASEPKSIRHLVPGPSYCSDKKKPVKRPISSRLSVITYPVKTYKKPVLPKQVPFAASRPSVGSTNGPVANISAAIACSSFTPSEYAKKVKALELLTGQRDVSVNPFCKIVVTGIDPKPFRLVKKGLIDMSILVCMVVNIQFVGKTAEFTIYKSYKGTFLYKLASNSFIKVISS